MSIDPLEPLATAIADKVWFKIQQRLQESESVQLVAIPEAARRMGISKSKLHDMIASGEFPKRATRNIGRRLLISLSEMERWVAAR